MPKDWTGNSNSIYKTLGASNHTDKERETNDYYATEGRAAELLLEVEKFTPTIWENAVGAGDLAKVFVEKGYNVRASDIVDRGYPNTEIIDFLTYNEPITTDIVSNPPYKCFSSDTECYTKQGWKRYEQLTKDDEILSVNPNTLEIEWSGINEIIYYNVDEDLFHFKKSHMDILCTKGHRMFAFNKDGKLQVKNNDLIHSQDIKMSYYIPRIGYSWSGQEKEYFVLPSINGYNYAQPTYKEEIKILMDDWLKFFGMWLADGYCRHTKNCFGDQRKTVGIKQRESNACMIRDILSRLPFKFKEYKDANRKNVCINFEIHNEQLWTYLKQFGKSSEKYIPTEIKELSSRQLSLFIDYYFYGDGSEYKNYNNQKSIGRTYRTISKKLSVDIQEILFKLGYLSHVTEQNYEINGEKRTIYLINYSPNSIYNRLFYPSAKKSLVHYKGVVWCVNLKKNGVFLLRRNGKEFISGNCATQFVKHSLDLAQDGVKVAMFLKIQFLEGKERKKLFTEYPPKTIYVSSSRLLCAKNGEFEKMKAGGGSAVAYAWYVWEKGYKGDTIIKWIN